MFKRSFRSRDANNTSQRDVAMKGTDSQYRVDKSARLTKKSGSLRDPHKWLKLQRSLTGGDTSNVRQSDKSVAPSPIVTLVVGQEGRLFAAHEEVLRQSPFFESVLRSGYHGAQSNRIVLSEEEPEVFSAILEYLYKGDYYPRLLHNAQRNSWELEDSLPIRGTSQTTPIVTDFPRDGRAEASARGQSSSSPATAAAVQASVYLPSVDDYVLRDTVIYCAAEHYGLEELKRLALRKQGLHVGIDVATILRSARYCYAHTPDTDSRLRAHYLALIIRCRKVFKRSGTMQAEMEKCGSGLYGEAGGKLFFDLFVAMCNHLDDVIDVSNAHTPKTI